LIYAGSEICLEGLPPQADCADQFLALQHVHCEITVALFFKKTSHPVYHGLGLLTRQRLLEETHDIFVFVDRSKIIQIEGVPSAETESGAGKEVVRFGHKRIFELRLFWNKKRWRLTSFN